MSTESPRVILCVYTTVLKKTDFGDYLSGHNDSRTSKMNNRPRNGRKQPRKGAKVSESESKRPEKAFLYRLHSCTHEQDCENKKNPRSSV